MLRVVLSQKRAWPERCLSGFDGIVEPTNMFGIRNAHQNTADIN
jgi:hypothetical protein